MGGGGSPGRQCPQDRSDEDNKTTQCSEGHRNLIWSDVRNMDRGELSSIEALLGSVEECGMVLITADQSSQLREQKVS